MKKKLIVLLGATAVGKTKVAVRLAKHLQTEIVYADSRQIYREMCIGTAKPTLEEQEGIPHHLVDCVSVTEHYTAGRYEKDALHALETIFQHHDVAILTGGTGLYVKAVCQGFDELPSDETIRQQLQKQYRQEGLASLWAELQANDPVFLERVDKNNPQRILRALEVIRLSGKPFSSFWTGTRKERSFEWLTVVLDRPREELYQRIHLRMDKMIQEGLLEEAQQLLPFREKNALQTVGYREIYD
ncbi:MAG: tRNA (adenosine(37)-N6)-dimethylallyltransferase MiaA, partial [Flammeovirgaceae bacterium]|nr:tRNA (adenosine(37)-N6)-dimethylallyltransferase MiaA [Flammeovirgaceae bacterium]MDW8288162.1 tRNA (adenosine(37)-N6)-dimethylallyltransferase MiaA [Flammeovirgaceae bacterium]